MSGYIGQILTAVSAALEFNSATLSGAIDIIVIEDDKGKRHCSPFYVRFGKLQLLKSRGIPVDIELNDCRTDLRMYLGAAGEAYFYDPSLADKLQTTSGDIPFLDGSSNPVEQNTQSDTPQPELPSAPDPAAISSSPKLETKPCSPAVPQSGQVPSEVLGTCPPSSDSHSIPTAFRPCASLPLVSHAQNDEEFYTRAIRSTSDLGFHSFGYMSDSEMELTRGERDGTTEVVDEPRSPPVSDPQRRWTTQWARGRSVLQKQTIAFADCSVVHYTPEVSLETKAIVSSANTSPEEKPDQGRDPMSAVTSLPSEDQLSSLFGLPGPIESTEESPAEPTPDTPSISNNDASTSIRHTGPNIIDDPKLDCESVLKSPSDNDVPIIVQMTTRSEKIPVGSSAILFPAGDADVDREEDSKLELRSLDGFEDSSGIVHDGIEEKLAEALQNKDDVVNSSSVSPCAEDGEGDPEGVIEMSLCGSALRDSLSEGDVMAVFEENRVSHAQFVADPNILYDKALLFRIEDRLVDFRVAAPFVMAMLAYKTPMDIDRLSKMLAKPIEEKPPKPVSSPPRRFGWFGWTSAVVEGEPLLAEEDLIAIAAENAERNVSAPEVPTIPVEDMVSHDVEDPVPIIYSEALVVNSNHGDLLNTGDAGCIEPGLDGKELVKEDEPGTAPSVQEDTSPEISREASVFAEADYASECFSFLPSSEQLGELDLKPGANEIRFVIASRSAELRCRVFLWSNDSKIVISDVDGTITRSDVLGHLLPAVGRDWSQVGVAGLYSQIAKNGYKMLYLTARPIGQASQTRDFLHNVTQGTARLPNGPVLMSPNRLVESFTREVIRRKPHEFKIACLRAVRCLFPPTYNPFHAGFGNRDTDVISYRAVGLIPQRIFVVNPSGELVVMKAKYESTSSYSSLQALVENVFPDINGKSGQEWIRQVTESATYNSWNYWRGSLPEVDLDALCGVSSSKA